MPLPWFCLLLCGLKKNKSSKVRSPKTILYLFLLLFLSPNQLPLSLGPNPTSPYLFLFLSDDHDSRSPAHINPPAHLPSAGYPPRRSTSLPPLFFFPFSRSPFSFRRPSHLFRPNLPRPTSLAPSHSPIGGPRLSGASPTSSRPTSPAWPPHHRRHSLPHRSLSPPRACINVPAQSHSRTASPPLPKRLH
jgi:hypothetical protein